MGTDAAEAVLELRTDSSVFMTDLDTAEQRGRKLGDTFKQIAQWFAQSGKASTDAGKQIVAMAKDSETGVNRVTVSVRAASDVLTRMGNTKISGGLVGEIGKIAAGFISAQAIIGTLEGGFRGLVGFIGDSVKAASDAEKAHAQLVAALRAQGTALPSVISAYVSYATALQRTTIFQDDAIEGAAALLVQVGNVMPRDMQKALKATTDLASGLGIELNSAVMLVSKAAEGNVSSLKKAGVVIDETKAKAQGFGFVLDQVEAKFGGQAATLAGTYQGRLTQLANTWNNVQESIGRVITQNKTVLDAFDLLNGQIDRNTGELNQNRDATNFVSDAVILLVRSVAALAGTGDTVQTWGSGFMITLRDLAAHLGNVGVLAYESARALGHVLMLPGIDAQIDQRVTVLKDAVAELGRRNEATTQTSIGIGNALSSIEAKANALGTELAKTRGQTVELKDATDGAADSWNRGTAAVTAATEAQKKQQKAAADLAQSMIPLTAAESERVLSLHAIGVVEGEIAAAMGKTELQVKRVIDAETDRETNVKRSSALMAKIKQQEIDDAQRALKVINDAYDKNFLAERKTGQDMADLVAKRTMTSVDYQVFQIQREAEARKDALDRTVLNYQSAVDAIDRLTQAAIDDAQAADIDAKMQEAKKNENTQLLAQAQAIREAAQLEIADLNRLADGFARIAQISGGAFGGIVRDIGNVIASIALANDAVAQFDAAQTRTGKAAAAAAGAGALVQATGQGSLLARMFGGAMTGMSTGSMVGAMIAGPAGAAVGAAIGAVSGATIGLVRKLFSMGGPSQAELDGRQTAAAWQKGLLAGLSSTQRSELGPATKRLFGGTADQSFNATQIAVRDAYKATGRSAEQAGQDILAVFKAEKQGAEATAAAVKKIQDAFDEQKAASDLLAETLSRYKFSIEELGPALQRQNLDKQSQQLYSDWQVLIGAGVSVDAVTREMGKSINDYIGQAIRTGTEVPAALKPMLQVMIDQGKLTDENGKKITDLSTSGITFSETMTEGFKGVKESIDELVKVIKISLGIALDDTKTKTDGIANSFSRWKPPTSSTAQPTVSWFQRPPQPTISMATGGYISAMRPTNIVMGDNGPEEAVFGGGGRRLAQDVAVELAAMGGASGGSGPLTVHVVLDRQIVATAVLDDIHGGGPTRTKFNAAVRKAL